MLSNRSVSLPAFHLALNTSSSQEGSDLVAPGPGVTQVPGGRVECRALNRPVRATAGPWAALVARGACPLGLPGARHHRGDNGWDHSCAAKPLQEGHGPLQGLGLQSYKGHQVSGGCPTETVSRSSPHVPSQNHNPGTNRGTESMIGCPSQALGLTLSIFVHSSNCQLLTGPMNTRPWT